MRKRKIFEELMEGISEMSAHREGKLTLRSYKIEPTPLPTVDSKLIRDTRKRLRCSRAVFARKLHINERTLEKWEQGRAKPNLQAAALILLARDYPDTMDRLEKLAGKVRSLLTNLGKTPKALRATLPQARNRVFARRHGKLNSSARFARRVPRRLRKK